MHIEGGDGQSLLQHEARRLGGFPVGKTHANGAVVDGAQFELSIGEGERDLARLPGDGADGVFFRVRQQSGGGEEGWKEEAHGIKTSGIGVIVGGADPAF